MSFGEDEPSAAKQPAMTDGTTPAKAKAQGRALEAPRKARGSKTVHKTDLPDPAHNRGSWMKSGGGYRAAVTKVHNVELKVLTEYKVHELCDRHGGNARYSITMKSAGMRTAAPTILVRQPKAHFSYVMTDYDLAPLMHDLEAAYVRNLKRQHGGCGGDGGEAPAHKRARMAGHSGN